jgi:heptosyltransferase III
MRILFITSNRIGDAVLSTGLLDHLIRTYPQARFTIACGPAAEGVFTRMPGLERLIVMEKRRFGLHWLPLWAATVGHWWHLVVDIRASAIGWLVPRRRRVAMRRRPGHKTEQLAAILGITPPPLPVAWTAQADRDRAVSLLPDGTPIIALAPTANWTGKIWPARRFVALYEALRAGPLPNARVAVLGGPGAQEHALAAPVLAALPHAIDLCGQVSLPEAAACVARCVLYIGNDSGLTHLAAATGTPTLSLFGPTPADEYAPAGRFAGVAVARGAGMENLSVADALAAATRLIGQPASEIRRTDHVIPTA